MTKKRFDNGDTDFGSWLRSSEPLSSSNGYVTSDIDYVWNDYNSNKFMFIEEKCNMATSDFSQSKTFKLVRSSINNSNFYGFHLIQFENTNPSNGKVYLDGEEIPEEQLEEFLKFNLPEVWYDSYY